MISANDNSVVPKELKTRKCAMKQGIGYKVFMFFFGGLVRQIATDAGNEVRGAIAEALALTGSDTDLGKLAKGVAEYRREQSNLVATATMKARELDTAARAKHAEAMRAANAEFAAATKVVAAENDKADKAGALVLKASNIESILKG